MVEALWSMVRRRPEAVTAALAMVFGVVTIASAHDVWFVYDDFSILGSRHEAVHTRGLVALFDPYNGHLMPLTLGWLLTMAHLVGLQSYAWWLVPVVIGNVIAVGIARRTMLVLGVSMWTASVAAPVLLLWGPFGWTLFWAPESVFLLGAALAVAQLLVAAEDDRPLARRDAWTSASATVAVMLHSAAVVGPAVAVAGLIVRRQWVRALVAGVPGVVYLSWLAAAGDHDAVRSTPDAVDRSPLSFVADMWSAPLRALLPGRLAGLVLVCVVFLGLCAVRRRGAAARRLASSLVAYAALATAAITRGRVGAPADLAQAGRYAAVLGFVLLPFVVTVVEMVVLRIRVAPARWLTWLVVATGIVAPNAWMAHDASGAMERRGASNRQQVGMIVAAGCLSTTPRDTPVDLWRGTTVAHVSRWRDENFLGLVTAVTERFCDNDGRSGLVLIHDTRPPMVDHTR